MDRPINQSEKFLLLHSCRRSQFLAIIDWLEKLHPGDLIIPLLLPHMKADPPLDHRLNPPIYLPTGSNRYTPECLEPAINEQLKKENFTGVLVPLNNTGRIDYDPVFRLAYRLGIRRIRVVEPDLRNKLLPPSHVLLLLQRFFASLAYSATALMALVLTPVIPPLSLASSPSPIAIARLSLFSPTESLQPLSRSTLSQLVKLRAKVLLLNRFTVIVCQPFNRFVLWLLRRHSRRF
jgi:hypothetical protein